MEKNNKKRIVKALIVLLYSISGMYFCIMNTFNTIPNEWLVISCVIAAVFWGIQSINISELVLNRKIEIIPFSVSMLICLSTLFCAHTNLSISIKILIGALPVVLFMCYAVVVSVKKVFFELLSKENRMFYIGASLILAFIIAFFYSKVNLLFKQYDYVYSMDGGFVFEHIYPELNYYTIRHPLMTIIFFPIYSTCFCLLKMLNAYSIVNLAILIQFIQIQFTIFTAMLLSKLSGSRWTKYLYISSGAVVVSLFFFEKFSIVIFLLVLTIYWIKMQNDESIVTAVLETGTMLTSGVVCVGYFLNRKECVKKRIQKFAYYFLHLILFFVACGKMNAILYGYRDALMMRGFCGGLQWKERLCSYLNMIGSCMISIAPDFLEGGIRWVGLTTTWNIFAVILIVLSIYVMIEYHMEYEVRISFAWLIFSFILIYMVGWSIVESPLFSIYFSWAMVLLIEKSFNVLNKFVKEKYVNIFVIIFMAIINSATTFQVISCLM